LLDRGVILPPRDEKEKATRLKFARIATIPNKVIPNTILIAWNSTVRPLKNLKMLPSKPDTEPPRQPPQRWLPEGSSV
jgi:hypothetical protein